jgi:septal ring factor EnvC (AmiA/AmiB activator)
MTRRITLVIFMLLCLTPSAWPKWKEDEQKYLDDQFKSVLDQMQTLGNQVAALNAQLGEMKQNQAQLQAAIIRQQHTLQDLDQMLSSLRIGNEENFAKLKTALTELRTETQNAVNKLTSQPAQQAGIPAEVAAAARPAAAPVRQTPQGYITAVEGGNVMIDMGSAQGVQQGFRLAVYRATDPNTRVGVIEVTQVIDAGTARARVVTMNAGVKPEFSDVVRVE